MMLKRGIIQETEAFAFPYLVQPIQFPLLLDKLEKVIE